MGTARENVLFNASSSTHPVQRIQFKPSSSTHQWAGLFSEFNQPGYLVGIKAGEGFAVA